LGTDNALTDILKDLFILASMQKFAARQRRTASAARVTAMTELARLLV
jgi:hypothetical protein